MVIILIGIGAFYWFQVRPSEIKKNCTQRIYYKCNTSGSPAQCRGSESTAREYDLCIHESGL